MIKGWRLNPDWRNYYEGREQMKAALALQKEMVANQREIVRMQKENFDQARDHMNTCHAAKVAAGQVIEKLVN